MIEGLNLAIRTFQNKADNEKAAMELRTMMGTPGWIFLEKVLDYNIDRYQKLLLGEEVPTKPLTEKEIEQLKYRRLDLKKLKEMPKAQLAVLEGREPEPSDDPYATVDDIRMEQAGESTVRPEA